MYGLELSLFCSNSLLDCLNSPFPRTVLMFCLFLPFDQCCRIAQLLPPPWPPYLHCFWLFGMAGPASAHLSLAGSIVWILRCPQLMSAFHQLITCTLFHVSSLLAFIPLHHQIIPLTFFLQLDPISNTEQNICLTYAIGIRFCSTRNVFTIV